VTPVAAWRGEPINTSCTGADGRYTISGLGPYRWRVQFPDHTRTHAWAWSGDAADRFAATPVKVLPGTAATADATLRPAGKLAGRVIGATLPNPYITVLAVNARTGDHAAPLALVRGEAEYDLAGLATQNVRISFVAAVGGATHWHPRRVAVTAGSTRHLDLRVPS